MKVDYYRCDYDMLIVQQCDLYTSIPHAHEGVELIYAKTGNRQTFLNGTEYTLQAGNILLIFPNSVHYHSNAVGETLLYLFPLSTLPEFNATFLKKYPKNPVLRHPNPEAIALLEKLNTSKYSPVVRRGLLLAAVAMILEDISLLETGIVESSKAGEILEFCNSHYTENISLDSVAKNLLISKSCVSHIFSTKLNIGFRDYINSLRLRHALPLLKQDNLSVTEIAYLSGFESIRTFNRAFQKNFHITPLQFKKNSP